MAPVLLVDGIQNLHGLSSPLSNLWGNLKFTFQNGKRALVKTLTKHLTCCSTSFQSWLILLNSGWLETFMIWS